MVDVSNEAVLAGVVREWAERELPGRPSDAERAAAVARACYLRGASVTEACRRARSFVDGRARHHPVRMGGREAVAQAAPRPRVPPNR